MAADRRHVVNEQLAQVEGIVEKLDKMIGAALDAFNRQERRCLDDLKNLGGALGDEIDAASKRIDELLAGKSGDERVALLKYRSIFSHQQVIAETLLSLAEPLSKRVAGGALFSSKAVSETNSLFEHQLEIQQSLKNIVQTGDTALLRSVVEEADKLGQECIECGTEHEARLVEGLCNAEAAPIYLTMLDLIRTVARHDREIANLLREKLS